MKKHSSLIISLILTLFLLTVSTPLIIAEATENSLIFPPDYGTEAFWYDSTAEASVFTGDFNVKGMLLMEYSTGKVLYGKNENASLPIASVTKVMSTLLIMEAIDSGKISYDDIVTVSEHAASMGGSQVFLEPNEQMSVNDLLKALVVSSANDATVALAEYTFGSEESFVNAMNEKAALLGMANTHFVNTNGLDAQGHYSSAYDVALMTRELMKHEDIFKYTTIWMDTIRNGAFGLSNTNKLIRFYPDATGMKTGYTSTSGFCVSATAKRNGMSVIAVVLGGQTSDERFSCAKKMMDFAFANYTVLTPEEVQLTDISVAGGVKSTTPLTYTPPSILTEKGGAEITTRFEIPEKIQAPVAAGDTVGAVRFYIGQEEVASAPVTAAEDNEKITFFTLLWRILSSFLA